MTIHLSLTTVGDIADFDANIRHGVESVRYYTAKKLFFYHICGCNSSFTSIICYKEAHKNPMRPVFS